MRRRRRPLSVGNDVRVGFFDSLDLMNLGNHDIGKRSLILRRNEQEDIRLPEAGMGLLHSSELLQ
jgi:hypothetical protein